MAIFNVLKKFGVKKIENPTVITPQVEPSKKVLVVEDEEALRELYVEVLKQEGFEVYSAPNGQIALSTIMHFPPNVVLLDLMMPVMNGKELLRVMHDKEESKNIPVIVLTNAGDIDSMNEVKFYSNVKTFLIKASVTPQDIVNNVKTIA